MTRSLPALPHVSERVRDLHSRMTLEEKLAQIVGYWLDHGGEVVAPMAGEMNNSREGTQLSEITENGIGHYTRVYGTRPVDPVERAAWLWEEQRRLVAETRLGIPALVHEECLTGLAAWKAATFPTPLAWGATFDPALVEEMAALIGADMKALGIHQGLAPVLDVIRDARWGRTEEAIGEDPYLVGTIGTAYVRGLQSAGVHATLKHFVGYSGSRAGRNHAPVSAGPREIADVFLPPFEMAVVDGGVRSVMASYNDVDGIPQHASTQSLTELLRETWGFDGVVVADYFGVAFLTVMHAIAADRGRAAALALEAGVDVELPTGDAYLAPLAELVRAGEVDEALVDRAVLRALAQKEELGLLDDDFVHRLGEPPTTIDLDSPRHREVARRLAAESIVLLANNGVLPLRSGSGAPGRVAVIGPNADRPEALMGCYSFANHVLAHQPDVPLGFEVPTIAAALRAQLPEAEVSVVAGCAVEGEDRSGFPAAVEAATTADVAVLVMGDQAGLFGRGTVGEGNDAESLELPGVQRELVEAVVATGTPVVLVLVTGRPYAAGWALDGVSTVSTGSGSGSSTEKPAAVLQAFFPGEEGGPALADILTGAVNPSGRLPVSLPRSAGAQPYSYLQPLLGGPSEVTSTDPTPVRPFGFGLSYTSFDYSELSADGEASTDGSFQVSVRVTNVGRVAGTDVVQVYGRDLLASVVRPVSQLLAYHRVTLGPGESAVVRFTIPATRLAFSDRTLTRVVEPGDVEVWVAASAGEKVATAVAEGIADSAAAADAAAAPVVGARVDRAVVRLTGDVHRVTTADPRRATAEVVAG